MNTRRLPPALVIALGLGCGDDGSGNETSTGPCLIAPLTESAEGPGSNTDTDGSEVSTSVCLSAPTVTVTESDGETGIPTTGTSTGSDTDTDTGSGSGTDTDTDTDTDTSGTTGMGDALPDHDAIVGRVLERGVLPPDVAAKLRKR